VNRSFDRSAHLRKGKEVENQALEFLSHKGLTLVERNFRCPRGEVDLIMMDRQELVFVEVRYRSNGTFGGALDSITSSKQQKLRIAAEIYLQRNSSLAFKGCRFDVLAIDGNGGKANTHWISDAF